MLIEHLTKASHDITFCLESLRSALRGASAVEALLLYEAIRRAAELAAQIGEMLNAVESMQKEPT